MTPAADAYRIKDKNPLVAAMAVERMKDQVRDLTNRYIKLRAAVRDYLGATPADREMYERKLRHEVGQWSE